MANHISLGKFGEKLAVEYLVRNRFTILKQNWRHGHYEIDIIAQKENTIHFVEVKTRRNTNFGYPEESVSEKKIEYLTAAADEFQFQNPDCKQIQFDILSILLNNNGTEEYFFIEDVDV